MGKDDIEEIDLAGYPANVTILAGSHNKITIHKLYGPTCVKDLVICWEKDDWNVRNNRKNIKQNGA